MATNDNLRQRKGKEKADSGSDGTPVTSGGAPNGNVNTWNNWGSLPGAGTNGSPGGTRQSFGFPSQSQSNEDETPQPQYKTANEYAQAVQQWLWQYHYWNQMNSMYYSTFPLYAMSCWPMQQQLPQHPGSAAGFANLQAAPTVPMGQVPPVGNNFRQVPVGPQVQQGPGPGVGRFQRPANGQRQGREYRIPSLWKRVLAEFIDFLLLFLVKLAVTILTVEYVGIVDIQKYDLDYLLNQNLDYNAAFAMTSELVAMEVINRIFICIFETLCLRRGVAGMIGGTTPGKRFLGLRVVSCEDIVEFPGRRIRVTPAQDIGFWNALVRSVIKNFSLAFFFPVCFTVFFFQHNRAAYDIIANCIVVEPLRDDWPRRR